MSIDTVGCKLRLVGVQYSSTVIKSENINSVTAFSFQHNRWSSHLEAVTNAASTFEYFSPLKWPSPESRQCAKLFLQSSELRLPQPLIRRRERDWESPNSDEGTYTVVLFIYTLHFSPLLKAPPLHWPPEGGRHHK